MQAAAEAEAQKASMLNKPAASNTETKVYWEDLLKDRYEEHKVEEFTAMGKGKRSRKQVYSNSVCNLLRLRMGKTRKSKEGP